MEIALSIIIPVYNVERYIDECVNSIMIQNQCGVEVLLIDDGSTDKSGDICDRLALSYNDIKVIHIQNGGPSFARNKGIDVAKGRYIAFIDSDDRIAARSISALKKWIYENDADLCFMSAIKFYSDGTSEPINDDIYKDEIKGKDKLHIMEYLASRTKFTGSACTKIYRRDFLNANMIRFPDDRRMHEDLYFVVQCIQSAKSYDVLEIPYYEYRQGRSGSRSLSSKEKNYMDLKLFVDETTAKYTNNRYPNDEESEYIMSFAAYEYTLLIWKYDELSIEMKHNLRSYLYSNRWILKFNHAKRNIMIRYILNILGVDITSKAMNYYMGRKKTGYENRSTNAS